MFYLSNLLSKKSRLDSILDNQLPLLLDNWTTPKKTEQKPNKKNPFNYLCSLFDKSINPYIHFDKSINRLYNMSYPCKCCKFYNTQPVQNCP